MGGGASGRIAMHFVGRDFDANDSLSHHQFVTLNRDRGQYSSRARWAGIPGRRRHVSVRPTWKTKVAIYKNTRLLAGNANMYRTTQNAQNCQSRSHARSIRLLFVKESSVAFVKLGFELDHTFALQHKFDHFRSAKALLP